MQASLGSMLWSLLATFTNTPAQKSPTSPQPNILLILADDLGWNDVGWKNPAIKTPNLNRLATNGVILDSSYAHSTCSPSRTALLTGRYPFKLGLQHGVVKKTKPYGLPLNVTILPQKLKSLGYSTHAIGKGAHLIENYMPISVWNTQEFDVIQPPWDYPALGK